MTASRTTTPRWVTFLAGATWLATLLMGLAVQWVTFGTDFLQLMLSFAVNSTTGAANQRPSSPSP